MRYKGRLLGWYVLLIHPGPATPDWTPGSISFHLTRDSIQNIWIFTFPPVRFSTSFAHHRCCCPNQDCWGVASAYFNVTGLNSWAIPVVENSGVTNARLHAATIRRTYIFFIFP